ncbi:MAG: hypothetical protein AAFQ94_23950 [Bacteroidota bacterium]
MKKIDLIVGLVAGIVLLGFKIKVDFDLFPEIKIEAIGLVLGFLYLFLGSTLLYIYLITLIIFDAVGLVNFRNQKFRLRPLYEVKNISRDILAIFLILGGFQRAIDQGFSKFIIISISLSLLILIFDQKNIRRTFKAMMNKQTS